MRSTLRWVCCCCAMLLNPACEGTPSPRATPAGSARPPATLAVASTCPTQKLRFTQATGCRNDGSVEFCLPKGAPDLEAQVRRIAPTLRSSSGGGRAACDRGAETLFLYPTPGADPSVCAAERGAMTEGAWRQLCQLAALPEIRAIVPTWYE